MAKTKKGRINLDILAGDCRMLPLFNKNSSAFLKLFILRIRRPKSDADLFRIIYGFCVASEDVVSPNVLAGQFTVVTTVKNYQYAVATLSVYGKIEVITDVVNGLLEGHRLVKAVADAGIECELSFDAGYDVDFAIRPVVFNDVCSTVPDAKPILTPYLNATAFSLSVWAVDKPFLLSYGKTLPYGWEAALKRIVLRLEEMSNLDFVKNGLARLGNIEFINTECADLKENGFVNTAFQDDCRKVEVTIDGQSFAKPVALIIRCRLSIGGQVVLDKCRCVEFEPDRELKVSFVSDEKFGTAEISIWRECADGEYRIWFSNMATAIHKIGLNMGLVSMSGRIKSNWLDRIKTNVKPVESKVVEAEKVERITYNKSTIRNEDSAPWIDSASVSRALCEHLFPKRTKAEFFPKGWSKEKNEHGDLLFLEWFKKRAENADELVLQDPYFDVKGLEFIARASNTATQYTVITQARLATNPDGTNRIVDKSDRSTRITDMINKNQYLFSGVKLKICDVDGADNILHDRYILLFRDGMLAEGFTLSNSIQGATVKQPLLITTIPYEILLKVNDHIQKLLDGRSVTLLYDYEKSVRDKSVQHTEIADAAYYERLKSELSSKKMITANRVAALLKPNDISFNKMFATFGRFLAHTKPDLIYFILKHIDSRKIGDDFICNLQNYIRKSYRLHPPLGYAGMEFSDSRECYAQMFYCGFGEILDCCNGLSFIGEVNCHRVWGVYYGAKILLCCDSKKYISILKSLHCQFAKQRNSRKTPTYSLCHVADIVMSVLLKRLSYNGDVKLAELFLCDKSEFVKSLGAVAILYASGNGKIANADIIKTYLSNEQIYDFCIRGLFTFYGVSQKEVFRRMLLQYLCECFERNCDDEKLRRLFDKINASSDANLQQLFVDEFVKSLLKIGVIDESKVDKMCSTVIFDHFDKDERYISLYSVNLLQCLNMLMPEFRRESDRRIAKLNSLVLRPFASHCESYYDAIERLKILKNMQSVLLPDKK